MKKKSAPTGISKMMQHYAIAITNMLGTCNELPAPAACGTIEYRAC